MNTTEKTTIKEWFTHYYPNDEISNNMNRNTTFFDLFKALENYKNVYEYIFSDGTSDSIVRDIIFNKLADIMGVDVDYIVEQYRKCDNRDKCLSGLTEEQTNQLLKALELH